MEVQQIYGVISPDGKIISGQGFRSHKIWSGTYIIEFDRPFANSPAPVCTIYGNEWKTFDKSVAIVEFDSRYFVYVTSSPDRPEDCGLTFIACGDVINF